MYEMAHNADQKSIMAIAKIEQHEAVCTERWNQSRESLNKLELVPQQIIELRGAVSILMRVAGWSVTAAVLGGSAIIWWFTTSFMDSVRLALQASGKPVP